MRLLTIMPADKDSRSDDKSVSSDADGEELSRKQVRRWLKLIVLVTTVLLNLSTLVEKVMAVLAWVVQVL
jgi:hypothetical protein